MPQLVTHKELQQYPWEGGERRKTGYLRVSTLQLGKLLYIVFICTPLQLPLGVVLAAFPPPLPLLSLVAGKVNEMERNEMNTLAHKYTPTDTHTHTNTNIHKHILSKCRPEGPENIRDVSAAVMPKKTVEYSVLCYLVSSRGGGR